MRRVLIALAIVMVSAVPTFAAKRGTARAELNVLIPSAHLTEVPLIDALDFVANMTQVNMVIDWKSLSAANIDKQSMINLSLHDVRGGRLLTMILNEAAGGDSLAWYIDDNIVRVTTKQAADSQIVTVVYYVQDLLMMNSPFNPTIQTGALQFSNTGTTGSGGASGGATGGGGGSSGGGIFGQSSQSQGNATANNNTTAATGLIKLIETIIRPEVWRDNNPDGKAAIEFFNGSLIVSAPRSVQEMIGGPLN